MCAAGLIVAGCDGADDADIVLYASADSYLVRRVVDAFETETGLAVAVVGDTEANKTTGLVERLRSERDHPHADVFWSSEIFMTVALADESMFAPCTTETTTAWPERWSDAEDRWFAFAARARVIVYAPDRVPPENRPATWTDLTRIDVGRGIVMADPRFGTTGGHLGAMKAWWDRHAMPGYYEAFLMGLHAKGLRLLPSGNAGVVRAVADGEADFGLTDTDDVWAAREQGLAVDLIYPDHSHEDEPGNGTLLIPNTVAVVAGGQHPEAAARFVDFMLSERVERMLAESVSHNIPVRPGVADDYAEFAVDDPLDVSFRRAAAARPTAVAAAMRILTAPPPPTPEAIREDRERIRALQRGDEPGETPETTSEDPDDEG